MPIIFFPVTLKEDVVGVYVSRNNVHTIDTVRIQEDGNYTNVMYRKIDNSLIYYNSGKWNTEGNYIIFKDFFSDQDDVHSKEVKSYQEVLITTKLPIEKKAGKIIIHHIPTYDNIYLEKIR